MEKYLIILSIIIIVFYCLYCNQKDNKETFTSLVGCNTDIATLTNLAKELQSPTGILIPSDLVLRYRHVFSSGDDDWLRLKSLANSTEHANMAVRNLNVDGSFNFLPRGMITVWNKNVAPSGWAFCDGTQGTPDLRGRFILGKGQGPNLTNRSLGDISGYKYQLLTINELPNHSHSIYGLGNLWPGGYNNHGGTPAYKNTTSQNTGSVGSGAFFNKMPPFYVLTYIMKL
jgi:microcystin-dependent protein